MNMVLSTLSLFSFFFHIALFSNLCFGAPASLHTDFHVSYKTLSPLGVPQRVSFFLFYFFFFLFNSFFLYYGYCFTFPLHGDVITLTASHRKYAVTLYLYLSCIGLYQIENRIVYNSHHNSPQ
ncbi:hypothetical protein Lalb_Chr15g0079731 [Lupinus albus]|uniref:Uncharacterized protein n=1 Tax=Lupinus albus TaxID=3870 RepID=A0A6A4PD00_LUPAL|nr:hypothetical protein Lalb_Chr15g0079731 [Lupinus albus]